MDIRFDGILMPISEESSCGDDLSFSPEFDLIQEARREDDATIDYGEWQSALKQADWPVVADRCADLLRRRSKDLRLCGWLTEGLAKTSGLAGLSQGIDITAQLMEHFGEHIHPQPDNGDQEQRIGNLAWFVMRMSQLVRQIPVTQAKFGNFTLNDYESACLLQLQLQRNSDSALDLNGKITLDKFSAAAAATDKLRYIEWLEDATRCISALAELTRVSDALFGIDGPSFATLSESLEAVYERLSRIAKDHGLAVAGAVVGGEGDLDHAISDPGTLPKVLSHAGPIKTREQALDLLRQVAVFFRDTEPHSPVAYLADKAAHWGEMPLHAWLRSVVKDSGTLAHIEELLGMETKLERASADD